MEKREKDRPKQLTLRLPDSLHARLLEAAAREKVTLNTYCLYILAMAVAQERGGSG